MARDVNNVIVDIIAEKKNFSQQQAADYVKSKTWIDFYAFKIQKNL